MDSQPLNMEQCKTKESEVEVVGVSTASLKEEHATATEKSSSKSSIRSKASKTSQKSKMGSDISLKSKSDASPKVCTTMMKGYRIPQYGILTHLEDGIPATQRG